MDTVESVLQQAKSELETFHNRLWSEHESTVPKHLFHYTSIEGLAGILSNRTVFLTDILASSDRSEIRHGLAVVGEVVGKSGEHALCQFLQRTLAQYPLLGMGTDLFTYAMCFCPGPDVLTQWRGYSADGGFAIGVDFLKLFAWANASQLGIMRILYEHDRQNSMVEQTLAHSMQVFDGIHSVLSDLPDPAKTRAFGTFMHDVAKWLFYTILRFKNEAFRSEDEWRIFLMDGPTPSGSDKLQFRARGRTIMPYVELPFRPELITHIYRSPGPWPESVEYGVRRLAASIGPDVVCETSKLPL